MIVQENTTLYSRKKRIALIVALCVILAASVIGATVLAFTQPKALAANYALVDVDLTVTIPNEITKVIISFESQFTFMGTPTWIEDISHPDIVFEGTGPHTTRITGLSPTKSRMTVTIYKQTGWSFNCIATYNGSSSYTYATVRSNVVSGYGDPVIPSSYKEYTLDLTFVGTHPLPVTPTKEGYDFTGWYTDEACTQQYTASTITGDIVLYAGWNPHTYEIAFVGNGSTGGSMANVDATYGEDVALPACSFSKTGYRFDGWSTSADGELIYTDTQTVRNLSPEQDAVVVLYAVWTAESYVIRYNSNGGIGSMTDQRILFDTNTPLIFNNENITREGYIFKGWARNPDGKVVYYNGQEVSNLTSEANEVITLYAVWEIIQCKITFIVDGVEWYVTYVDYGTPASEVVGQYVDTVLYTVNGFSADDNEILEGQLPN